MIISVISSHSTSFPPRIQIHSDVCHSITENHTVANCDRTATLNCISPAGHYLEFDDWCFTLVRPLQLVKIKIKINKKELKRGTILSY